MKRTANSDRISRTTSSGSREMIEPGARRKESAASLKVRCRVTNIPASRGGGGRERSSATSPCASPCAAAAFLSRILEPRVPLFAPTPCAMDASSCAASLASMAPAGRRGHSKPKRCSRLCIIVCRPGARPATMNRAGNGDNAQQGKKSSVQLECALINHAAQKQKNGGWRWPHKNKNGFTGFAFEGHFFCSKPRTKGLSAPHTPRE